MVDDMSPAEFDLFMGGEDEEEQDLPPQPRPHVYHNFEITQRADGSASVWEWTNEADDDGQPIAMPTGKRTEFPSLDAALRYSGRSHVRSSGVKVNVILDGRRI